MVDNLVLFASNLSFVMAGLVPAIHALLCSQGVDARHKARADGAADEENLCGKYSEIGPQDSRPVNEI